MAFGFPAYHSEIRNLTVSPDITWDLAEQALKNAGFKDLGYHATALDYKTQGTAMTLSERVLVFIGFKEMKIHSECIFPGQFIDFGKNKMNVKAFLREYDKLLSEHLKEQI